MSTLDELYPLVPPRPPRRPRKSGRPNYNLVHAKPLPVKTHPLPPLIPHNPLSLLQIAYTYLSQLIVPPSSHPKFRIRGYYSSATNSIHITEHSSILLLWNNGFFGKGSLSRSEPTWLDREKKRLGLLTIDTSEEHTAARREERKRFKNERARKEREAIEEKLMEELLVERIASNHKTMGAVITGNGDGDGKGKAGKPTLRSKYEGLAEAALLSPTKGIGFFGGEKMLPTPPATPSPEPAGRDPGEEEAAKPISDGTAAATALMIDKDKAPAEIETQEHLQLTPEEAFFLTYALGILDTYPEPSLNPTSITPSLSSTTPLNPPDLLTLLTTPTPSSTNPRPNDPFLLLYTTYHHFRSLGWVVRPGLKFGVDYLLYLRGPVFSHAEYAVVVQPAYTDPFWRTEEGQEMRDGEGEEKPRSWHWLHCLQRVQSQVRKTLVVAWVDVPPPVDREDEDGDGDGGRDAVGSEMAITPFLQRYKVREMVVKRWIPNRSRD